MKYFYKILHNGKPVMVKTSKKREDFETEYSEKDFITECNRLQENFKTEEAAREELFKPIREQNERIWTKLRELALDALGESDLS